ncbi:type VI secretion system-associated protein TagO [Budvicia aquatica]|uniref:Type VI secretion-associated protein, VC_A0118 family n=1 Tax=Budvicia aquatica TaxID=82979 RepID=A0A484ZUG8_9GAMM|nr:type VI secretion system-associated protein TagO [Budvicia aquatica]VFS52567.1 type VI secretion-associated protein, VC_A0118 family [Budvicia aquatica]
MNNVIQYSILAFCLSIGSALAEPTDVEKLSALAACSKESSALNRLDCYDSVMRPLAVVINTDAQIKRSQSWLSAYAQEKDRHENDTDFLVTNSGGDNPKVLLTSPAFRATATETGFGIQLHRQYHSNANYAGCTND